MVMKGKLVHKLYIIKGIALGDSMNILDNSNETMLWYKRLRRISMTSLLKLCKQKLIDSKEISSLDFCEKCVIEKAHSLRSAAATHRLKAVLNYIHSYLRESL